jgi:hypothetical protein
MSTIEPREWVNKGKPWKKATPIEQLEVMCKEANVPMLGTLGNQEHLTAEYPEDHTPFSYTAWPVPLPGYFITAIDFKEGPGGDQLVKDAIANRLPWVKYINHRNKKYSRKNNWKPTWSSDVHCHCSIMSNHCFTNILPYNPFKGGFVNTMDQWEALAKTMQVTNAAQEVHLRIHSKLDLVLLKLGVAQADIDELQSRPALTFSDEQIDTLAERITQNMDVNGLEQADKPLIVEAVKTALREGIE